MKTIPFYKMSGSGNDFIIIDNRKENLFVSDAKLLVRQLCRRKLSLGADGLILLESSNQADFRFGFTIPTAAGRKCAAMGLVVYHVLPI